MNGVGCERFNLDLAIVIPFGQTPQLQTAP
jgi:hypothetical protein